MSFDYTSLFIVFIIIAYILSIVNGISLYYNKISMKLYLIYSAISIIICWFSVYKSSIMADEFNLTGTSSLDTLALINIIIIVLATFISRYKSKN